MLPRRGRGMLKKGRATISAVLLHCASLIQKFFKGDAVSKLKSFTWIAGAWFGVAAQAMAFDILQALPKQPPIPKDNPQSAAKIELGKQLFFDQRLSANLSLSCNSCHTLMGAGTDGRPTTVGATGTPGVRNASTLWNVGFQTVLHWDGRHLSLEEQAKAHLLDPTVMAMPDEAAVVERIRSIPGYQAQFTKVFGKDGATYDNIAKALASFERTLLTPGSALDRWVKGDKKALSPAAQRGRHLFNELGCMSCHFGVNLAGPAPGPYLQMGMGFYELFPNYLGSEYDARYRLLEEQGRYHVTGDEQDKLLWRLPTLRNVALTAPYFHNGSVATLDEAVRVMAKTELDRTLTEDQVKDIVAWLESLTGEFPKFTLPRLPRGSVAPIGAAVPR